jgi:vancomycin resistance protein YoaR
MPGVAGYGMRPITDEPTRDNVRPGDEPTRSGTPRMAPPAPSAPQSDHTTQIPAVPWGAEAATGVLPAVPGWGAPGAGYPQAGATAPLGTMPGGGGPAVGVPGTKRKWLVPAVAVGAVVALVLALAGVTVAFAGEVPRGTTVLGVDVGGGSQAEAAAALKAGLGNRVDKPVTVRIGKSQATVKPKEVGLAIDYRATAAKAVESWPNPFTVWFGERTVEPVVTVDPAKLDAVLQKLAASSTEKITRPAIRYQGLTPKPVYPGAGRGLDPDKSGQALQKGWLRDKAVTIPIVQIDAVTSKADVDKLLKDLAKPAVAAPVTVKTSKGTFTLSPRAIAKSLVMESDERGEIIPKVDGKKLHAAAKDEFAKVEVPAKDAKPSIRGGKVVIKGEVVGRAVDLKQLAPALLPVLRKSAPREVTAGFTEVKPKLTREQVGKLGVKEKISEFTTQFKGGEDRNKNILVVADEVDGALVRPGKTFSLNGYTGERSYAQGYVDAPVIIDGKIKNYVGGGISQFATTLFNASYYAGMVDVHHQPHGYYISRYPSVIEATVFYPSLDLKFQNDSKYGVLIDTSYTNNSITVAFWSTKRYDIKTHWDPKHDFVQPKTIHLKDKDCLPTEGIPGFSQTAYRIFYSGGKELKRERFSWRYKAEPKFVCDNSDSRSPR